MNTVTMTLDARAPLATTAEYVRILHGILSGTRAAGAVEIEPFNHDLLVVDDQSIETPFDARSTPSMQGTPSDEAFDQLRTSIKAVGTLGADWDGYGAEPISQQSIDHALLFAALYKDKAESFQASPDSDGTISLETHWGSNEAHLNFSRAGEIAYVLQTVSGRHRGRTFDSTAMKDLLDVLYF